MRIKRGFTLVELLVVISIIALLIGILLPAIGKARDSAKVTISLVNLKQFGTAHATYASEWDGRQWTTAPDDMTLLLINRQYAIEYPPDIYPLIPVVPLGFTRDGDHASTFRGWATQPMWWTGNCSIGSFRAFHTKPFNHYINNKVYDKMFWAPKDYTINERIFEFQQDPGEWPAGGGIPFYFSTYAASVAAQVSPDVFRGTANAQRARDLPGGHRSPTLSSASYPDLKTHMLEHYWLQNNPSENIPNTGGVPWFFNMGPDSTPATLFYDGHTRMMSVREAVRSDRRVQAQGAAPLVAWDRACFQSSGYFEGHAYNGARDEINSYHVFTRDGIKGRDTTGS